MQVLSLHRTNKNEGVNGELNVQEVLIADEHSSLVANGGLNDPRDRLKYARRLLYVSHLFSQFSEVAWQFCLILFLAAFSNYSLILVSTYGLVSGIAVCLTGSKAGRFIDGSNRLFVAQRFIWTENVSVLIATLFCYILLERTKTVDTDAFTAKPDPAWSYWFRSRLDGVPLDCISVVMLIGIHTLGSIAQILDRGFVVAIERDWIVVMSRLASPFHRSENTSSVIVLNSTQHMPDEAERAWLSTTNIAMRQIDLSCKVVAPAIAGFFIAAFDEGTDTGHGADLSGAALLVGLVNAAALVVEYVCTARIYALIPDLATKTPPRPSSRVNLNQEVEENGDHIKPPSIGCGICRITIPEGLEIYFEQSVSPGGLALSLLYLNALTFSALMTAYLVWRGMRLETVGVWRGVSSAVGLMGTFAYSLSMKHCSVETTGMWSITVQFLFLSVSYVSLFVGDYNTSLSLLIGGVCASRVGLWVFDIAVTQLMQEYIPSDVRGVVGGVQQSLNAFFGLGSFILGIIIPDPQDFPVYVAAGYGSVGIAMLMYTFGIYARRDQLMVPP